MEESRSKRFEDKYKYDSDIIALSNLKDIILSFFSIEFSLLLLAFFILYWLLPSYKIQNFALLAFNYLIIYCFSPYFAFIVFAFTCFIYCLALFIDSVRTRFIFLACVCLAIVFLCFFKYYAYIKDEFDWILHVLGLEFLQVDIIFPLGISFYTFASITYLRAVYEGGKSDVKDPHYEEGNPALEGFIPLATYLSFFATFLAGPIMRSQFFFTQYHTKRYFGDSNLIITLILFAIIKKALIANYLQIYSQPILSEPSAYHSLELLCAISAYSVQLYCDFSGYVNLVCAFGLMLGFSLPQNFNMPYAARNIKDFWNRWHISLSTFIRDYIYIPLGGNRRGFVLTQIFVLIAFGLSGLWHGNTATYLIWGLLHGLGLIWLNALKALDINLSESSAVGAFISSCITFIFVCFCWIFFYYHSLEEVGEYFNALWHNFGTQANFKTNGVGNAPLYVWWWFVIGFALFMLYPLMRTGIELCTQVLSHIHWILKPFVLAVILTLLVGFMPSGIPNFIYASF